MVGILIIIGEFVNKKSDHGRFFLTIFRHTWENTENPKEFLKNQNSAEISIIWFRIINDFIVRSANI